MINDGLTNPFSGKHMAQEASEVAAELELTRPDMDRWSLRSHELAIKATDEGRLPEEIVPVTVKGKKGDTVVEIDEAPRRDTSLESLAKLPPIFVKDGSTRLETRPGSTTAAAPWSWPAMSGPSATGRRCWPRSSLRRRSRTISPTSPGHPPRRPRRRSRRLGSRPRMSIRARRTYRIGMRTPAAPPGGSRRPLRPPSELGYRAARLTARMHLRGLDARYGLPGSHTPG